MSWLSGEGSLTEQYMERACRGLERIARALETLAERCPKCGLPRQPQTVCTSSSDASESYLVGAFGAMSICRCNEPKKRRRKKQ